jgi:hypothetical protein
MVLGLTVCEKVIVEQGTGNVTLVSAFTKFVVNEFPTPPQKFAVYTALTAGLGDGTIELVVTNLETNEEIHAVQLPVHFADRLTELRVLFRIASCSFPAAGDYQLTLLIDGEWLAQRRIQVEARED